MLVLKLNCHSKFTIKKAPSSLKNYSALVSLTLAVLTFPGRNQPSIISVVSLTSVFGMGTGVTLQLYPPGNLL